MLQEAYGDEFYHKLKFLNGLKDLKKGDKTLQTVHITAKSDRNIEKLLSLFEKIILVEEQLTSYQTLTKKLLGKYYMTVLT